MCTPNHVEIRDLRCASQITVQRCFRVMHLANHAAKSLCEWLNLYIVFWGAELVWPFNHFRTIYRALHMYKSTGNASSMHVWLAGYPDIFCRWNAKSKIRSLMCTLRNSKFAITSIVCTLHNSRCAPRITIQIRTLPSCENSLSKKDNSSNFLENCKTKSNNYLVKHLSH